MLITILAVLAINIAFFLLTRYMLRKHFRGVNKWLKNELELYKAKEQLLQATNSKPLEEFAGFKVVVGGPTEMAKEINRHLMTLPEVRRFHSFKQFRQKLSIEKVAQDARHLDEMEHELFERANDAVRQELTPQV
jgi:hypothetical protein